MTGYLKPTQSTYSPGVRFNFEFRAWMDAGRQGRTCPLHHSTTTKLLMTLGTCIEPLRNELISHIYKEVLQGEYLRHSIIKGLDANCIRKNQTTRKENRKARLDQGLVGKRGASTPECALWISPTSEYVGHPVNDRHSTQRQKQNDKGKKEERNRTRECRP